MSDKKIQVELSEKLLDSNGFKYDKDYLADLFDQDKVKEPHGSEDGASQSVHKLIKEMGGVETIAKGLESDLTKGIMDGAQADLERRRRIFGSNKRIPRKIKTLWELFCDNFEDFILKVLIAAAAVSLVLGIINEGLAKGWIEGVSIFIAIAIILTVNTSNNYVKEKQFQALQAKQDVSSARVIRDGHMTTVDAEELVVGDIIKIPAGDNVPADCVAYKSITLVANQSSLTGEPEGIHKTHVDADNYSHHPDPFLLQNTLIETGECMALVLAVGHNTRSGRAERVMNVESEQTPLQAKLESIADMIGKMGGSVAALTFIAIVVKLLCTIFLYKERTLSDPQNLTDLLNAFIIAVTIIVVAVPEGLPLAVTISLAFSVSEMANMGNLVRRLSASETMGGANEICTDKTGTLTQNNMTVQAFYVNNTVIKGDKWADIKSTQTCDLVAQSVCYNSSAFIDLKDGKKVTIGNVTECGLIKYLLTSGIDCEQLISHRNEKDFMLFDIPFSSSRKRATSVIRLPNGDIRVFVKGAPEIVIEMCEKFHAENGAVQNLKSEKKNSIISSEVKNFAKQTFRTLLIAYVDIPAKEWNNMASQNNNFKELSDKEVVESGLTMVGVFALVDPLRPGVADAVDTCHRAGVNVRMCTGDNIDTAIAISRQAHILEDKDLRELEDSEYKHYICMTGKDFREAVGGLISEPSKKNDGTTIESLGNIKTFRKIKDKLKVLARSQPEDKFMLVTGLKQEGAVVAVTGDGNNDAPALIKSDVGFSMGKAGTDVCKNASAIVLTEDDFCSVIVAIKYGRNIYDNVRKFLQFQLTVNVAAMFIVFAGALLLADEALTPVQMLWVNLIMDTLAALALATEPPGDALLNRPPHSRKDKIINATMWRNIIGHAIYQIAVMMVILYYGVTLFNLPNYDKEEPFFVTKFWAEENLDNENQTLAYLANNAVDTNTFDTPTAKCTLYTMVFQSFVMCQIFNMINARKLGDREFNVFHSFFNNFRFLLIFFIIFAMQIFICERGGMVTRSSGLTWGQHEICAGIGAFSLIWAVIIKLIMPSRWFNNLSINEEEMPEEEEAKSFVTTMRKSFRESLKKRIENEMSRSAKGSQKLQTGINN